MKTKNILLYLLIAVLVGCVPVVSLHPLYYKESDVVFKKQLLGTWIDDSNNCWQFTCPNEQQKLYTLLFRTKTGVKGLFDIYLVQLEGKLFLDIKPSRNTLEKDMGTMEYPANMWLISLGHTFGVIDQLEPQLKMRFTDNDAFKKFINKDPNAVKYEITDDRIVLTASPKELQQFVVKYAEDKRIFDDEKTLSRKIASEPNDPNSTGPKKN